MSPTPRLDVLKALGDNTRYAIYLELARSSRPLATADIAQSLELHANTVRPHLERMREVGLLEVQVGGRGDVGRPQHRYAVAPDAPSLGLEPPTMPVLVNMVLDMAERLQASRSDAVAVGEREGRRRSSPYQRAPSTLEALVSDLDTLGFDPLVTDPDEHVDPGDRLDGLDPPAPADDAAAVVAFANCPFADVAREHPELVCGLHEGLVAGFVAGMGDATTREFCNLTSRTPCQVTVAAR